MQGGLTSEALKVSFSLLTAFLVLIVIMDKVFID